MKSSEEMTEYVLEKLNEHRKKINRRNELVKKFTLFEMKGGKIMNTKFAVASMAVALMLVMTATVSVISLNMGKPDFNKIPDENLALVSSATSSCTTTALTALSETAKTIRTETTAVAISEIRQTTVSTFMAESVETTKAVTKTTSTETIAVKDTDFAEKPPETTGKTTGNTVETTAEDTATHTTATTEEVQTTTAPVEMPVFSDIDIFSVTPQSTDGVDEFMELHHEKYGHDGSGNCYNVTPKEITDKYGLCIFKFDGDGGGNIYGEGFLLYENEIYHLGDAWGGYGLSSFAIADIDHNGSNELYFAFSWGSGIHRSELCYFDMQSKEIIDFGEYSYVDNDTVFDSKDGVLLVCHAEWDYKTGFFTEGEEVGKIVFEDEKIRLVPTARFDNWWDLRM